MIRIITLFLALFLAEAALALDCRDEFRASPQKPDNMLRYLQCLEEKIAKHDVAGFPVGTIVSSMLKPDDFARAAGDIPSFDSSKSKWALADGRQVSTVCRYAQLTGNTRLPDLRGMFLRGLNVGRSDGKEDPEGRNRESGSFQNDMVGSHTHPFNTVGIWRRSFKGEDGSPRTAHEQAGRTGPNEGLESRPRNIAVYYYIRVN